MLLIPFDCGRISQVEWEKMRCQSALMLSQLVHFRTSLGLGIG